MSFPALLRATALSIGCLVLVVPARGQESQPAGQPTGLEVVQRAAKAAGGKGAFEKIRTLVVRGTFSMPSAKVNGTIVTQYVAPNRARVTTDLGASGKTIRIIRDKQGWEITPSGRHTLSASRCRRVLDLISMRNAFDAPSVYASIRNRGLEIVDGKKAYRLELVRPGNDGIDHVFYDAETWLPMKTITQPDAGSTTTIVSLVSDYKDFAGIKVATTVTQHLPTGVATSSIRIEAVEVNGKVDDSLFEPPVPAVQKAK